MQPHQIIVDMAPERAASLIKVTHPPFLLLPPWENVNRSTTLINSTWLASSWLSMREITWFTSSK